ncbi:MAG TPA: lamin tail domain-containing protein [Polyangia bacterium]|jgi:endonuclease YncB( thermonuclease family)
MRLSAAGVIGAALVLLAVAACGPPTPRSTAPERALPRDDGRAPAAPAAAAAAAAAPAPAPAPAPEPAPAPAAAPAPAPEPAAPAGVAATDDGAAPPPAAKRHRRRGAPASRPAPPPITGPIEKKVTRVVDGDTVVLEGGDRVRVANINAPEIDEELGLESRAAAVKLVQGKRARIAAAIRDHYGRLVGDVVVGGVSLAEELVKAGLAHVYLIPPVDAARGHVLLAREAEARAKRLGIWKTARYKGAFHITSFHANPPGDDREDLNAEYVRIANVSGAPQSLKGFALTNRKGHRFSFRNVTVPAGYTIMVHTGSGENQTDPARQLALYWNRRYAAWANGGDTATLLDPQGQVVDSATYDPKHKKVYPKK